MQPTKTQAIKTFLTASTFADFAERYHYGMEVQVLVAQDGGERIDGDYKGKRWQAYTDGINTWKPIRIPFNAATDPHYEDSPMNYDLSRYAEGIGMTGWNWLEKKSYWVGYDFDAIVGHSEAHKGKLTDRELGLVQTAATEIPWVTVRKSTSGNGLHLYVELDGFPTANHTEHAAVARAILGKMSASVGFDFHLKVDACGAILWNWHRKMKGTQGLSLIKKGEILHTVPANWRDHIVVIKGHKAKTLPTVVTENNDSELERLFEDITGQRSNIQLDEEHRRLISWLDDNNKHTWWDQDRWLLVAHTADLKEAHDELGLKGVFETITKRGSAQNCFCFSGDTEVITDKGVRTLRELASIGHARLYVKTLDGMEWIDCPVNSFGHQKTVPIYFGNGTHCHTTMNHQWHELKNKKFSWDKKFTYELIPDKTQLPLAPMILPPFNHEYEEGYAHGFVFGDGWNVYSRNNKATTEVALFKDDNGLLPLLLKFGNYGAQRFNKSPYVNVVRGMPEHWKLMPKNKSKSYALGFVLGMISADGSVCETVQAFQSDWGVLDDLRRMAIFAGLRPKHVRPYGDEIDHRRFDNSKQCYALTISRYNLEKKHFLRQDQREAFKIAQKTTATTIKFIIPDLVQTEEVFCATVPVWGNFTLGNGIITGNCFPLRKGAWTIRRFTQGVQEHPYWNQDGAGWTTCFYNREPDLASASKFSKGLEHKNGGYVFQHADEAVAAAKLIGVNVELPAWALRRPAKLKENKDGRLIMELEQEKHDANGGGLQGWIPEGKSWSKVFNANLRQPSEIEVGNYDDLVRHIVSEGGDDCGWTVKTGDTWVSEPLGHVKPALQGALGLTPKEVTAVVGSSVFRHWKLVSKPFQPEYPGDRQWNRGAAQLAYYPTENRDNLQYPTWLSILRHCGEGLDDAIKTNGWCKTNNILNGADYLKCWVASLFQHPFAPLPYLFLYSPEQNTGKSIFHEALSLLMTSGVVHADNALTSKSNFNGELENAVLCVIEEVDLSKSTVAANRTKNWVTAQKLQIQPKGVDPYDIPNKTHWVQTANSASYCLVLPGDTRITMMYVKPLEPQELIPKAKLLDMLKKEAPDFIAEILSIELPISNDRLNLPVIVTGEKINAQAANQSRLDAYLQEKWFHVTGKMIKLSDFYESFQAWLDPNDVNEWTKQRISKEMPPHFPKGRRKNDGQWYFGNISSEPYSSEEPVLPKLVARGEYLVRVEE